jgi:hypothetical protein
MLKGKEKEKTKKDTDENVIRAVGVCVGDIENRDE